VLRSKFVSRSVRTACTLPRRSPSRRRARRNEASGWPVPPAVSG